MGIVTIGQSPRTDVVPDIAALLPPGTPVIERGALDDAGPADLARLAPVPGEDVLVSRMRDGTEVAMAEARLLPLVQDAVDHVTGRGVAVVAVLCTGTLPRLRCPAPLLQPGPLVRSLVAAAASGARLGVVVPVGRPDRAGPRRLGAGGRARAGAGRLAVRVSRGAEPGRPTPSRRSVPTSSCSTAWASTAR